MDKKAHALKPLVVLSPHSDDAAYSVAGSMRQHLLRFGDVHLVTVFSRSTYVEPGCPSPQDDVTLRRKREDEQFVARLGHGIDACGKVHISWLDFDDAPLRDGYQSGDVCISRPPLAGDLHLAERLARQLVSVLGENATLFAPLGLGQHIDHIIVREAALAVASNCGSVFLYEDIPYAAECAPERVDSIVEAFAFSRRLRLVASTADIVSGVDWKINAARSYATQFTPATGHAILAHSRRVSPDGAERIWRVHYASTEKETERLAAESACSGIAISLLGGASVPGSAKNPASPEPAIPQPDVPEMPWSVVMIESVGRCNASCSYCPRGAGLVEDGASSPITSEILEHALRVARTGRAKALYLHHRGEPFLHPDIDEVVSRVRGAGFAAYLSTNLISATPERIDRVLRAGLNQLEIHLSGGLTRLPLDELLARIHHARRSNWRLRNNGCRIEVNYGLMNETKESVMARLRSIPQYDETMPIRFYIPHDWPLLFENMSVGVDYRRCAWYRERCCAVLSTGDVVICCLDQLRRSTVANVANIDRIGMEHISRRSLCDGCLQHGWDMAWFAEDALRIPPWLERGIARSSVANEQGEQG